MTTDLDRIVRRDPFRPLRQPAKRIYDAFQDEALNRNGASFEEWSENEVRRVWREARDYAQENGLTVPMLDDVASCERYARGHIDYGAKWAYAVARMLGA